MREAEHWNARLIREQAELERALSSVEGGFSFEYAKGLGTAADATLEVLRVNVAEVMRRNGEDPGNPALLALRVQQAAYSLNSRADRERAEAGI